MTELLPLVIVVVVWLVCGVCAMGAGPDRYAVRLFWLTFALMGPLGIAAALIMKAIEDYAPDQAPPRPLPATPVQKALKTGDRVRVDDRGDAYHGKIGVIDEITGETDGYNIYVAFGNDPQTRSFSRSELRPAGTATRTPRSKRAKQTTSG